MQPLSRRDILEDPYIRLFDDRKILKSADDGGSGADARAYFTADHDQTIYAELSSANKNDTGGYAIQVRALDRPGDDHGNSTTEATALELGGVVSGDLLLRGDVDYFKVNLEAEQNYVHSGEATGEGTPPIRLWKFAVVVMVLL